MSDFSFPYFAIYKCTNALCSENNKSNFLGCGYENMNFPGVQESGCPKCGNVYLKWLNYSDFEKCWNEKGKGI